MRKVLFFLFGGVGGAERMTVNIGKMLPRSRYDVIFVVCGCSGEIYDFIPSDYRMINIPWHNVYCFPRIRMANHIIKEKPDIVFSSVAALNVLLLQVSKLLNVKCIVRHDNMIQYIGERERRRVARCYRWAYRIVAQQEEMQQDLMNLTGLDGGKVLCLHNPLDSSVILSKSESPSPYPDDGCIKYLWVANYLQTKGHDVLAEAFKIVHQKNPRSSLYFVGNIVESFPNYIKTKKIVEDAGLGEFVHFVGYQQNPYKWMKYSDCFVLPSRMEGLPNALIEAQFLGVPAVATECIPVIGRIVENGVTGYTVPIDDVEAMAEAMLEAPSLGRIQMKYTSASAEQFITLFRND